MRTYPDGMKYCITGHMKNGKRFPAIYTNHPQHYNIWRGTLWIIINDKRKKIKDYLN